MEQNRESRNQPTFTQSFDFAKFCQGYPMGKGQSFQNMLLQQLNIHIEKNKYFPLRHTILKINSRWIVKVT